MHDVNVLVLQSTHTPPLWPSTSQAEYRTAPLTKCSRRFNSCAANFNLACRSASLLKQCEKDVIK